MNWVLRRWWFFLFSSALLIASLTGLAFGGLRPGLEFTGGSRWIVQSTASVEQVRSALEQADEQLEQIKVASITNQRANNYEIELNFVGETEKQALVSAVAEQGITLSEISFQTVGPALSQELLFKTGVAIALGVIVILSYVWYQFHDWRFGVAAIVAMLHDTIILLGTFAWLGYFLGVTVDILFVTAVLTTLSFSVHDTIVVFDRIRELSKTTRKTDDPGFLANAAITQTLVRSVNNSLTIVIMLSALLLLGGESLRWFAAALLAGTLTGTYSSPFIAVPLWFELKRKR
jgi:preprotein translocase subunit SecF